MNTKTNEHKAAETHQGIDPLAKSDIESGITLLNAIVGYVDNQKQIALIDDDSDQVLILTSILAMVQKAGATIERGYGLALGNGVGNGAGLIGNADAWMSDPGERQRRREAHADHAGTGAES